MWHLQHARYAYSRWQPGSHSAIVVCLAGMVSKSSPLPLHFCMCFDGGKVFLRPLVPALDAMAGSAMQCPTTAWLAGTRPFDLS